MISFNEIVSKWSNELFVEIAIPPGAFILDTNTTLPDNDGIFWLNWSESTGAKNYSLYWSINPGVNESDDLYIANLTNNSILIKGINSGIYYFRIVSCNDTGTTWSNELAIVVQRPTDNIPFANICMIIILLGIISLFIFGKRKIFDSKFFIHYLL